MKIVFMGTPDFAVPVLDALEKHNEDIILVVTQPDRPRGRKKTPEPSPVKKWALERGIEVFQPEKIRKPEAVDFMKGKTCDAIVVAAFGQILPKEILEIPKYGCINVHASLLPRYRGAAPIQYAVINGDKSTGVTIMQMGPGLDDGDILSQEEIPICDDDTGGSMFEKLSVLGGDLLVRTLDGIEAGTVKPRPQDPDKATHVGMIKKEDGNIDFGKRSREIVNLIRGMDPWPSAFTFYKGKMIKIWKAEELGFDSRDYEPGTVFVPDKNTLLVSTGDGAIKVLELQEEGSKRMAASSFLAGHEIDPGDMFERERKA